MVSKSILFNTEFTNDFRYILLTGTLGENKLELYDNTIIRNKWCNISVFCSIHRNGDVVKTINQLTLANHPQFWCILDVEKVGYKFIFQSECLNKALIEVRNVQNSM